jgi:membrane fusion protein, multidrug efflux system
MKGIINNLITKTIIVKIIRPYMAFSIFIFAFLVLGACSQEKQEVEEEQIERIPIIIEKSEEDSYQTKVDFSGTFFPNKEANLGASLPGRIEKFHYQAGAYVKEGSLLVELSAEALLQALIENQALRKDYERVSRLKEKGSISEMDYDHLKAKLEASDIKTEMFRKNTSVTAPFDGVIVEYLVEEGENYFFSINIEPGYSHTSGILRLMQLNPLKVIIEVNEKDLHHFSKGRQVRVICDALNNKEVIGKVKYIRPILSTVSRTAKIEIEVPNPKNEIMPGMFAKVIVNSDYFKGVKIPLSAIYRQPGTPEDYVFVIKNDTAYRKPVNRLQVVGDMVYVDGIEKNEYVATEGKNRLIDKSLVEIKN